MKFAAIRLSDCQSSKSTLAKDCRNSSDEDNATLSHTQTWPFVQTNKFTPKSTQLPSQPLGPVTTHKKRSISASVNTTSEYSDSFFDTSLHRTSLAGKTDTRDTSITSTSREAASEASFREAQLRYVMDELISTEKAFVLSLGLLQERILKPLFDRCELQRSRCPPLENLLQLVAKLTVMHSPLIELQGQELLSRVAKILQDTQTYVLYYINADVFSYLWRCEQSVFDHKFLESISHKLESNEVEGAGAKLDLSVLLLVQKPMARIVKYQLLIGSISKFNPHNKAISDTLQSVKNSLHQINSGVGEALQDGSELQLLKSNVNFENTMGMCPQFYGRLKLATVAGFGWPKYRKGWSLTNTQVLALFFEQCIVFCDFGLRIKKAKPLLVLPYQSCDFLNGAGEYDGGLIDKSGISAKVRFRHGGCEFEVLLRFPSSKVFLDVLAYLTSVNRSPSSRDVECYLPSSFAPSDICIEDRLVQRHRYDQCYFRKVLEFETRSPSKRLLTSRFVTSLLRLVKSREK